jgi:exopolyphosphatase/guanosine-5'-triphosphate,3'-diphosphate pyrophosphatase
MHLFTGLRSLHRLPAEYGEWLSAAAMLYEVGDFLNRNGRHRHTYYIISNSEILGYTPEQRRIIAAIARYLGNSRPTMEDGPMKAIDSSERASVQKAILLLRLARALNLGRSHAVQEVKIGLRAGDVRLTLVPRRRVGVDLELWAIEKDCVYFREVFGRELSTAAA